MKHRLVRSRAPLRLGLGGGGTDVAPFCDAHGGAVLNAAISKFAHVTIEWRGDGRTCLHAADINERWEGEAEKRLPLDGTVNLLKGVYNRMVSDFNDNTPLSINVTTYADAPAGSGLGTSSSIVVALTEAFRFWLDAPLGAYEIAQLAYKIEREDLRLSGGKQDQYAATFGGINFMEFYEEGRVIINPLRVPDRIIQELESGLVIYFTGVSRESANIIEEQSHNMLKNDVGSMEALHRLKTDAYSMKNFLLRGDIRNLAKTLGTSWEQKKKTATSIANPDIDRVYDLAMSAGAVGGKVSGAGGGGFMMFLIDPPRREGLIKVLRDQGGHPSTCVISPSGACSWRIN
jgi:D-glycero-alpha-D-manno-heptose-7-phosphate kinase